MSVSSLISVRDDFNARIQEIENYLRFVNDLIEGRLVIAPDPTKGGVIPTTDEGELLLKTFKANFFLLLYNLVEATTKNSIQAIFDEFKSKGVTYDQCTSAVKRIAIKNLKRERLVLDDICPRLGIIAEHIMTETFNKDLLLSGNVDAIALKNLAKEYGFSAPTNRCDKFRDVKNNRNLLAHGNKTFNEVGRDYVVGDLIVIKEQVLKFLSKFIDNIEIYLSSQSYLAPPSLSATSIPAVTITASGNGVIVS